MLHAHHKMLHTASSTPATNLPLVFSLQQAAAAAAARRLRPWPANAMVTTPCIRRINTTAQPWTSCSGQAALATDPG